MEKDKSLRSCDMTEGIERTAHRALFFSLGLKRDDFSKPMIAVANCWNEIVPGCVHLRQVADEVKKGIIEAGGLPFEFNTIAVCDGMAQGHVGMKYSLPSRDIITASIEIMVEAHRFDGVVLVTSCDKVTPGMIMAAARMDVPAIIVPAGAMKAGLHKGVKLTLSMMREYAGKYQAGQISKEELYEVEEVACPSLGSCSMIGTANTMACLSETLGMSLPLSATTLANSSAKLRDAKEAGLRIMDLVREDIRPSQIMTREAFINAMKVSMAMGASTNSILHIPAMAHELGIDIELEEFDRLSAVTPYVTKINPSGPETINEFHDAGGVPALLKSLKGMLNTGCMTVSGKTIGEIADQARWSDQEMIRPASNPHSNEGGLKILKGNLAPKGAVVKRSAVKRDMWQHTGPARVFDSMEDAIEAVKANNVLPGSVIVIRYEGPVGGPGMREMQMITAMIVGSGLADNTSLVTDGRFSGSTRGPCVGHVSPEAALGGPIAIVRDGDVIAMDLINGTLELKLGEDEIQKRLKEWKMPARDIKGIHKLYAKGAPKVEKGAVWE